MFLLIVERRQPRKRFTRCEVEGVGVEIGPVS
jgi:hypothetical protein